MPTVNVPISSTTQMADTSATANNIVLRDSAAGITGAIVTGSTLVTTGGFQGSVAVKTSAFTAGGFTDYSCSDSGGSYAVTMPTASANTGVKFTFFKTNSSANTITLTGVLGVGTMTSQYSQVIVTSDGSNWYGK